MWDETVKIISQGNLEDSKPAYWTKLQEPRDKLNGQAGNESRQCMMFHFALWLSANTDIREYRVMVDCDVLTSPTVHLRGHPFFVLFGKKEFKQRFDRWLARYQKWFGDMEMRNEMVPSIPMNQTHRLTFVPTPFARCDFFDSKQFPEGFVDRWAWVIQNCQKPVYMLPQAGFAFSNEKEAVLYKLKWCEDGQ